MRGYMLLCWLLAFIPALPFLFDTVENIDNIPIFFSQKIKFIKYTSYMVLTQRVQNLIPHLKVLQDCAKCCAVK